MSRSGQPPDLKKYMDKQLQIKLNANRQVVGTLRGFDQFMNLVIDNTVEVNGNEKNEIGMVVIRGNSVVTIEALEPVARPQTHVQNFIRHTMTMWGHECPIVRLPVERLMASLRRPEQCNNESTLDPCRICLVIPA
ncbi:putative small nuclear ribonucleoprotein G [Capsicum annuum]|nr:putative small nuclear ribonucleoprotein G [Capsicum annuum]